MPTNLMEHCQRAAEIVATWPKWKQNILTDSNKPQWEKPRMPQATNPAENLTPGAIKAQNARPKFEVEKKKPGEIGYRVPMDARFGQGVVECTGEFRLPKKGDWVLSFDLLRAEYATQDFTCNSCHICRPVGPYGPPIEEDFPPAPAVQEIQPLSELTKKFEVKDSGERQQFDSGMVRDTTEGKVDFHRVFDGPMLRRWAEHLTKGATKYPDVKPGVANWTLAAGEEELARFRASAVRHFVQWMLGDTDEDHAAAVMFNLNGYEYVLGKMQP